MLRKRGSRVRSLFQRRRKPHNGDTLDDVPTVRQIDNKCEDSISNHDQSKSLPLLYALCKTWAWPAVEFRCATNHEEAAVHYVDRNGDNCLHWACFGKPPVEVVKRLIEACPELASCPNANGSLPIHVACAYRASHDVIRHLLVANPDGACTRGRATGGEGSFPLHMLCDSGSSIESLKVILETKQGLSTLDALDGTYQQTPLAILNARKNLGMFLRDLKVLKRRQEDDDASDSYDELYSAEFWEKASLLVFAEYNRMTKGTESPPVPSEYDSTQTEIVHACVGLPTCSTSLLEFAMLLHPHQLMQLDSRNGQLPLHIAAAMPSFFQPTRSSRLIEVLLKSPPEAARVCDTNDKIPLELAVESGKSWREGVGALVAAWPPALEVLFLPDALYPHVWRNLMRLPHHDGTSCVFESLRAKPSIIRCSASSS